jgi:hypothetical protein
MNGQERRGSATVVAVSMIALVGAAVGVLTQVLVSEAQATRRRMEAVQVDQMLAAGAVAAGRMLPPVKQLEAGRIGTFNVVLAGELAERAGLVTIRSEPGAGKVSWSFEIEARLGETAAKQTVRFARTHVGWVAVGAVRGE